MKLTAITVIDNGREKVLPGETFSRPASEARSLIAAGAASPVGEPRPAAPGPDPGTPDPETPAVDPAKNENPEPGQRDPLTGLPTE